MSGARFRGAVLLAGGVLFALPASLAAAPIEESELPDQRPPAAAAAAARSNSIPAISGSFSERLAAAEAAYAQGNYETAIVAYADAARLAPDVPQRVKTLVTLAALQQQQGLPDAAAKSLFDAVYLDPSLQVAVELYPQELIELFYAAQKDALAARSREAARLVRTARETADRGDLGGARTLLEGALTLVANDPGALLQMAALDLKEKRSQDALAGYERLVSLRMAKPDSVPDEMASNALANLGRLYIERGLNEDGAARLREALAIDPSIVEAWMQLALAQRALGRRDEARDSLLQARALRPGDENILHNLALYFLEASRFAEATALLRDATERNPQSARLWQLFGSALRSNSEPQPAVAAFSRVLELDPTNATGLAQPSAVHLAQLAFDRGDDAVAEREARRALGWDGKDARALDVLGLALQRTGDLEGAATAFAGAVEVDPARAETFNYLGSVRYRQARWSEAQAAFSRAVALRPTLIEAADNLALTQKRLEEVENIRRQLGFAAARFERAGSMKGILAGEVLTTGVAGKAGLQNGDVIVRVEGAPIESPADLNAYLVKVPPPRGLAIEILRANKLSKLKFKFPR